MLRPMASDGGKRRDRHSTRRLFRNGRNQAIRIPVEFELPGEEALIHREGHRIEQLSVENWLA